MLLKGKTMSQQRQKNYYFLSIRNEKSENFEFIDEFYSTLEEALQAAERLSEFEEFTPVRVFDFNHNICESVQLENGKIAFVLSNKNITFNKELQVCLQNFVKEYTQD